MAKQRQKGHTNREYSLTILKIEQNQSKSSQNCKEPDKTPAKKVKYSSKITLKKF